MKKYKPGQELTTMRQVIEAQLEGWAIQSEDGDEWTDVFHVIVPAASLDNPLEYACRVKPKPKPKCFCNGVEVEAPETEPLVVGREYYLPLFNAGGKYASNQWADDSVDWAYLEMGLIYLSKEAALKRREAMLKLTETGEEQ